MHVRRIDNDCALWTVHGEKSTKPEGEARTDVYMRSRISLGNTARKERGMAKVEDAMLGRWEVDLQRYGVELSVMLCLIV